MRKLLIIGVTGLVGSKLVSASHKYGLQPHGTYNARDPKIPRSERLDITDRDSTMKLVKDVRPDIIIDTAALHNVDYCETHKEETTRVNVKGTRNITDAALEVNSRLVYVSTDYVFDGRRGNYTETDTPNPLHHYAKTKLEAERIASAVSNHAVSRPSVIYGWNSLEKTGATSSSGKTMNFAMFVLDKLGKKETVRAVNDQFSSPTLANNLAEALVRLSLSRETGIFHMAGASCVSRYEFALKIAQIFGYSQSLVTPVSTEDLKQIAERPKNSCLSVRKAETVLGMRFLTVDEGLCEMKQRQSVAAYL